MQAMEALKVLSGYGVPLLGKLLVLDLRTMEFRQINIVCVEQTAQPALICNC